MCSKLAAHAGVFRARVTCRPPQKMPLRLRRQVNSTGTEAELRYFQLEDRYVRIAIASDEAAQQAKERLITKLNADGHEVTDAAPMVQGQARVDYAEQVALSVLRHDAERGIIVSSRGVGASVAANRVPGVRAALCNDAYSAHVGAKTEGMNVLVLALHSLGENMAEEVVAAYLDAALAPI